MPEIQDVSIRHDAIMQFMLANPTVPLGEVAKTFGVTQPWLSCVIHSAAFQDLLKQRQDQMFHFTVVEKMNAVASKSLDNLMVHLQASNVNPGFNLDVADKVLNRLGYAPQRAAAPAVQAVQMNFSVSRDDLAAARAMIVQPQQLPAPSHDIYSDSNSVGATIEHPTSVC